jgi:hypothetical protein
MIAPPFKKFFPRLAAFVGVPGYLFLDNFCLKFVLVYIVAARRGRRKTRRHSYTHISQSSTQNGYHWLPLVTIWLPLVTSGYKWLPKFTIQNTWSKTYKAHAEQRQLLHPHNYAIQQLHKHKPAQLKRSGGVNSAAWTLAVSRPVQNKNKNHSLSVRNKHFA